MVLTGLQAPSLTRSQALLLCDLPYPERAEEGLRMRDPGPGRALQRHVAKLKFPISAFAVFAFLADFSDCDSC